MCGCDDVVCIFDVGVGCVVVGLLVVCCFDEVVGWLEEFGVECIMIVLDVC